MKTLTLKDGKTYKLAEVDEKGYAELLAWAKAKLPDPLAEIKDVIKDFPQRLQEVMVKDAMQHKRIPKAIDAPEVQALLKTPEGAEKIVLMIFQKHQPDLTADQIWAIHNQAREELGDNYFEELPRG